MADIKDVSTHQTVILQDPSPFTKGLGLGLPAPIPGPPADVVSRIVNQQPSQSIPAPQPDSVPTNNKPQP
jgi:hypothetical protein